MVERRGRERRKGRGREKKKERYVQRLECRKEREFVMNKHLCPLCKSTAASENFSRNYFPEAG